VRTGGWIACVMALVFGGWTLDRMAACQIFGLSQGDVEQTTCAALAGAKLDEDIGHLDLTGCVFDLRHATVDYDGFELSAVYAPLRVSDGPTGGDIPVLVRVQEPLLRATLLEFVQAEAPPDPDVWFAAHVAPRVAPISGTLRSPRHLSVTDRDHLARHVENLGMGGVLLVEASDLPSPWSTGATALLLGGLAVWALFFPPLGIVAGTGRRRSGQSQ